MKYLVKPLFYPNKTVNLNKISLASKKDKNVQLAIKLPSETLLYSDKDSYTKIKAIMGSYPSVTTQFVSST